MHKTPRCDRKPGFKDFLSDLAEADDAMSILKQWLNG